jgi:ATP-dependent Clp protease ATP-binding subunit ClpC
MIAPDLLDRFTTHLKEALQKALTFAVTQGRERIEPGDLIVGLLHEKGSIGSEILLKAGCGLEAAESHFRGSPSSPVPVATPDLSPAVKRIVEKCVLTAHLYEHKYIGTEHLLSALLATEDPTLLAYFESQGISVSMLREQTLSVLKSTSRFPDLSSQEIPEPDEDVASSTPSAMRGPTQRQVRASALETFARELTKPEHADTLDPVIGRERELERVIEILCRRTKNNPILLGDPGVGKTAIVEGLAKRLASGDVPDCLFGKRILSLDLALTVAGTMYRGEFEARLKQIVEEAKHDPNAILFIDEIHTIVGAGSTTGSLDAANILKPALARGEIHCIGATTWAEYKKHIEPDAALERRFQTVSVEEPTAEATLAMLQGLQSRYASHHGIEYAPETLRVAVDLAERYLTDRLFPDKAIDLLDESAASVVAKRTSRDALERLAALDVAIQAANETKEAAVEEGRLQDANSADQDAERLRSERETLAAKLHTDREKYTPLVTGRDVAAIVARMANVPLTTILSTERERLAHLEMALQRTVLGQDAALKEISDVIRRARLGLTDERRPKAAVMLVGPSGTGKTESARALARELFGREDALIKIDMSEFSEGHTVSKLVGSPAGYVGYRENTKLTDAIRKRPHAVVLFDEFEKAHPDVQNLLLQILEDGHISDGSGRTIPFRHAYIILTSNVGSDQLGKKALGFGDTDMHFDQVVRQELAAQFRPELLNRLDRIVVFNPLSRDHLKEILQRHVTDILARVERTQHVACHAGDDVLEWLMNQPLPPEEGARAIRRLVEREVTSAIGRLLTEKPAKRKITFKAGKNLHAT